MREATGDLAEHHAGIDVEVLVEGVIDQERLRVQSTGAAIAVVVDAGSITAGCSRKLSIAALLSMIVSPGERPWADLILAANKCGGQLAIACD